MPDEIQFCEFRTALYRGGIVTIAARASPSPFHPNPTLLDDRSRHKRRRVYNMGGRSRQVDNTSNHNSEARNNRIPDIRTNRTLTPVQRQMR